MTFKPTNGSQQHINQLVHVLVLALRDMACMKCNYHVSLLTLFNYRVPCKHQTIFSGAQIKLKTLWRWQVGLRDFWHKLPSKAFEIKRKCGWKEENRKVDFIKILFPRPFFKLPTFSPLKSQIAKLSFKSSCCVWSDLEWVHVLRQLSHHKRCSVRNHRLIGARHLIGNCVMRKLKNCEEDVH